MAILLMVGTCIIFVLLLVMIYYFEKRSTKLFDECIEQIELYQKSLFLWEEILTSTPTRLLMYEIELFSGTNKEARAITRTYAFIHYTTTLEKLLRCSTEPNNPNYSVCLTLAQVLHNTPVFRNAICHREERYPLLSRMMKSMESAE